MKSTIIPGVFTHYRIIDKFNATFADSQEFLIEQKTSSLNAIIISALKSVSNAAYYNGYSNLENDDIRTSLANNFNTIGQP